VQFIIFEIRKLFILFISDYFLYSIKWLSTGMISSARGGDYIVDLI